MVGTDRYNLSACQPPSIRSSNLQKKNESQSALLPPIAWPRRIWGERNLPFIFSYPHRSFLSSLRLLLKFKIFWPRARSLFDVSTLMTLSDACMGCVPTSVITSCYSLALAYNNPLSSLCNGPERWIYGVGGANCHASVVLNIKPLTSRRIKIIGQYPSRGMSSMATRRVGVFCATKARLIRGPIVLSLSNDKVMAITHTPFRTKAQIISYPRPVLRVSCFDMGPVCSYLVTRLVLYISGIRQIFECFLAQTN